MRRAGNRSTAETDAAGYEALKGGIAGAAKYGAITATLGAAAYMFSPVYRALTIQFKVFIQLSGMTLGCMIEADRRIREYEFMMRRAKKMKADEEVWEKWAGMVDEDGKKSR